MDCRKVVSWVPLLYLIYVNEISSIAPNLKTTLFADDTTLTASNASVEDLMRDLNVCLGKFTNWTLANRLCLNAAKTSVLLFSNRLHFRDIDLRIIMGGVDVDFRESTKFLGLEVNHRLEFSCHLSVITEKLSKVVGVLLKLSHYLPCTH